MAFAAMFSSLDDEKETGGDSQACFDSKPAIFVKQGSRKAYPCRKTWENQLCKKLHDVERGHV
jgi:hypothetical protein